MGVIDGRANDVIIRSLMKYKILYKSRLGEAIEGEMLRYQEEVDPEVLAGLWYEIGMNSTGERQRNCFEKAIELVSNYDNKAVIILYCNFVILAVFDFILVCISLSLDKG